MYILTPNVIYLNRWRDLTCGICGYIDKTNITYDKLIWDMTSVLTDSGLDSTGTYINNNIALGHTGISTKDLKSGFQPMSRIINGKRYTVVYNGTLYNRTELKEDLTNKGYEFLTSTDNEIVLLTYIQYGDAGVKLLNGIFSYAIYDESKSSLFLARDKLGIKPLFYSSNANFIFASEIKAILKHPYVSAKVGKDELCEIFSLGPAHTPGKTFFKGIYELLPGHYGIYANNNLKTYKYWDLETKEITDTIEESIDKVRKLVKDSLNRQLISNVPVCSMLSGGLDSSILAYLASQQMDDLCTFSIDFEGNEVNFSGTDYQPTRDSDYVNIMKDLIKSRHTNLYFSTSDIFNNLKDAMIARDMPGMADVDSSMLVFCRKIKACGFDVAISGECSDEIFGGYPWYYKDHLIDSTNFPWSRSIDTRKNIVNPKLISTEYLENYINNAFESICQNVVYNSTDEKENMFRKTCYNTIKWFMNTLVERTDRMSMLSGLEVKVPYADYRIFEYIYNVCAKYKLGLVDGNDTPIEKYLLRKAFEQELPHDVVYRKKSPFPKTYDPEYTKLLEGEIKDIINNSSSPLLEIINVRYLYELLDTQGNNLKENWFGQLMTYPQMLAYLIQINMWLEEYKVDIDI